METPTHIGITKSILHRELAVIDAMLNDLTRTIRILDCDIAAEEERTGIRDVADPRYSILARTLSARRENLKGTIAWLEVRLALIRGLGQAIAA